VKSWKTLDRYKAVSPLTGRVLRAVARSSRGLPPPDPGHKSNRKSKSKGCLMRVGAGVGHGLKIGELGRIEPKA